MRKLGIICLLLCLLLVCSAGCGGRYSIGIVKGEEYIESCPDRAGAGETVTVKTCYVCDGELKISLNGAEGGSFTDETTYTFVMPEGDVEISVSVSTEGFAGA